MQRHLSPLWRTMLIAAGLGLLVAVYIFQRLNIIGPEGFFFPEAGANAVFVANRAVRLILNDFACFLLIYAIFKEYKYVRLAFLVFLVEFFLILPLYLLLKLSLEGDSEISTPLLSLIHRLIVNPTLMFLLIAGFVYQKNLRKR